MVNEFMNCPRCRQCPEVVGQREEAFVHCAFLGQMVWGDSIMCPHGSFLNDCF